LFWRHFVQKGRMQSVLEKIPVYIIRNESVGIRGAKEVCRRLLRKQGFMPGRGELAAWSEATPRSVPLNVVIPPLPVGSGAEVAPPTAFAFPLTGDLPDAYEAEVTYRPDGKQTEKVVIRKRATATPAAGAWVAPAAGGARAAPPPSHPSHPATEERVMQSAFKAGLLGGAIASAVGVTATLITLAFMGGKRSHRL